MSNWLGKGPQVTTWWLPWLLLRIPRCKVPCRTCNTHVGQPWCIPQAGEHTLFLFSLAVPNSSPWWRVGKVFGRTVHVFRFPKCAPVAFKKGAPITPETSGCRGGAVLVSSFLWFITYCNKSSHGGLTGPPEGWTQSFTRSIKDLLFHSTGPSS